MPADVLVRNVVIPLTGSTDNKVGSIFSQILQATNFVLTFFKKANEISKSFVIDIDRPEVNVSCPTMNLMQSNSAQKLYTGQTLKLSAILFCLQCLQLQRCAMLFVNESCFHGSFRTMIPIINESLMESRNSLFYTGVNWISNKECCARRRHQVQGQLISFHGICGMYLHVPALDA